MNAILLRALFILAPLLWVNDVLAQYNIRCGKCCICPLCCISPTVDREWGSGHPPGNSPNTTPATIRPSLETEKRNRELQRDVSELRGLTEKPPLRSVATKPTEALTPLYGQVPGSLRMAIDSKPKDFVGLLPGIVPNQRPREGALEHLRDAAGILALLPKDWKKIDPNDGVFLANEAAAALIGGPVRVKLERQGEPLYKVGSTALSAIDQKMADLERATKALRDVRMKSATFQMDRELKFRDITAQRNGCDTLGNCQTANGKAAWEEIERLDAEIGLISQIEKEATSSVEKMAKELISILAPDFFTEAKPVTDTPPLGATTKPRK